MGQAAWPTVGNGEATANIPHDTYECVSAGLIASHLYKLLCTPHVVLHNMLLLQAHLGTWLPSDWSIDLATSTSADLLQLERAANLAGSHVCCATPSWC